MQPLQDYRVSLQLPADGRKSLNRLYAFVSQAGFNIPIHDENGNAAVGNASGGLTPRALQRVRDYIEAHLAEHIELEALADITGFSRCYFARACKQSIGVLRSGAKAPTIGNRNNVANLVQLHSNKNSVGSGKFRSHVQGWSDR
jgi:AraC-like DNA-binding protein